jgi:hypothetical protein
MPRFRLRKRNGKLKAITKLKKLKEVTNSGKRCRKKIAASKTL